MKKIFLFITCLLITSPAFALRENNEISVRVLLEAIQDDDEQLVKKNAEILTQKFGRKVWDYKFSCHKNNLNQKCTIAEFAFDRVRKKRNAKVFSKLIEYGLDITTPFSDGQNALTKSVDVYKDIELVKMLLNPYKPFPVDLKNKKGETALFLALKNNNSEMLNYLISKKANVNGETPFGSSLLSYAWLEQKNIQNTTFLLNAGANIDELDQNGNTMLISAIKQNNFSQIKDIVSFGANINKAGENGETPLSYAIENEDLKLIKFLISNGADTNKIAKNGERPLTIAIEKGNSKIIDLLIENGADTNQTGKNGKTLLMTAIEKNNLKLVQSFLKIPNMLEKKDSKGRTALMIAFEKNSTNIINFLMDRNADITVVDKNGRNLMMIAAENQNESLILKLKQKNININATDNYHDSVLQYAVNANATPNFINFLIKNGANKTNETTNRIVVQGDDLKLIERLLKKQEKNIKKRDSRGHDLLFYAMKCRNEELLFNKIELFKKYGANLQESYQEGTKITDFIRNDQLIKSPKFWELLKETYKMEENEYD